MGAFRAVCGFVDRDVYDVAILSDLRDPGATSSVVATEARALAAGGSSIVLVPAASAHDLPFHADVTAVLRDGIADLACPGEPVRATLLISDGTPPPHISAERSTTLPAGRSGVIPAPRPADPPARTQQRVLLIGDETDRLLAIARRLPAALEPVLLTGNETLPATGMLVEHLPGVTGERWPGFLRARLRHLIDLHEARTVVLDGPPHDGLLAATADHRRVTWWWLRAAMWRRGRGTRWRGRSAAFHAVLEPGEFAAAGDEGWTVRDRAGVTNLAPITMLDRTELLDRESARARLGLGDEPCVVLRDVDVTVPGFTVIDPEPECLRAADLVVSGAGYAAFHETLAAGVPAVFVPDVGDGVDDDQLARARFAAAAGVAMCAEPGADLPLVTAVVRQRCAQPAFENGASEAAELIAARCLALAAA
jgi:hypothetical protein